MCTVACQDRFTDFVMRADFKNSRRAAAKNDHSAKGQLGLNKQSYSSDIKKTYVAVKQKYYYVSTVITTVAHLWCTYLLLLHIQLVASGYT